jgi:hypothetical protein
MRTIAIIALFFALFISFVASVEEVEFDFNSSGRELDGMSCGKVSFFVVPGMGVYDLLAKL